MEKKLLILTMVMVLGVFYINFSSANFVCGKVNDYDNLSANWLKVHVWYNEKVSEVTNCTINPENKFCCDLDDLKSVKFSVGKKVTAEIFNEAESYVSNLVELTTTADGYSLFPEMRLQEAIKINNKSSEVLVNQSTAMIYLSLAEGYSSLSYILQSAEGSSNVSVCTGCSNVNLSIPLVAGENRVTLIAQGLHVIKKNFVFYNLDYLNISREFSCNGCVERQNSIPAREDITVTVRVLSSHSIEEEVTEFYPVSFNLLSENYTDYSASHNYFTKQMQGSYLEYSYVVKAPSVLIPRKYVFKTQLDGFSESDTALINKNWFSLYIPKGFVESVWLPNKFFRIAPNEPLVIKDADSFVSMIAIFPKEEGSAFYRILTKESPSGGISYKVLTNLPDKKIDKIFVRLVSDNRTHLTLFSPDEVTLSIIEKEGEKIYEGYINSREFVVKE